MRGKIKIAADFSLLAAAHNLARLGTARPAPRLRRLGGGHRVTPPQDRPTDTNEAPAQQPDPRPGHTPNHTAHSSPHRR